MEERSDFKGNLVSSARLMSHISVRPVDERTTFFGGRLMNEPLFFTTDLMNEPHFLKDLVAKLSGEGREELKESSNSKPEILTYYMYRLMSHILLKIKADERAIKVSDSKINEPHSFDGPATFFYRVVDEWATKVRLMSHKILANLKLSLRNSKYNSLTICLLKITNRKICLLFLVKGKTND